MNKYFPPNSITIESLLKTEIILPGLINPAAIKTMETSKTDTNPNPSILLIFVKSLLPQYCEIKTLHPPHKPTSIIVKKKKY